MIAIILSLLALCLIAEGYFIYIRLLRIESLVNEKIDRISVGLNRATGNMARDILSRMGLLLRKELIIKNVLKVP